MPLIEEAGAHLVAISPMLEKYARQMAAKHHLGFPLLLDPGNRVAGQFGLIYTFPDYLRGIYLRLGLDLPRYSGDESWTLPLPARYVVTSDRIIRQAEVGTDYTVRPEPAATVDFLKQLQAAGAEGDNHA